MDLLITSKYIFGHDLCLPVSILRTERCFFVQRGFTGLVHSCGGGKNKTAYPCLVTSFNKLQRALEVVAEIFAGILHAFAGFDESSKMQNGIKLPRAQGVG